MQARGNDVLDVCGKFALPSSLYLAISLIFSIIITRISQDLDLRLAFVGPSRSLQS